jgi:hypothetical protein
MLLGRVEQPEQVVCEVTSLVKYTEMIDGRIILEWFLKCRVEE